MKHMPTWWYKHKNEEIHIFFPRRGWMWHTPPPPPNRSLNYSQFIWRWGALSSNVLALLLRNQSPIYVACPIHARTTHNEQCIIMIAVAWSNFCLVVCGEIVPHAQVKITDVELPPTLQQRLERTTAYKTKIEEQ